MDGDGGGLAWWVRCGGGGGDSEDLPLNISREMLQNNPVVTQIRNGLLGRVLGELESTATKDAAAYEKIWTAFGPVLKEGLYEERERRAQLLGLTRFATTAGGPRPPPPDAPPLTARPAPEQH